MAFLQGRDIAIQSTGVFAKAEVDSLMPEVTPPGMTKSIQSLIAERAAAKQAKNYAEADRIRKELLDAGIVLEDSAKGTIWRHT
jgi:cysteinyl-tRNA synthetase